jgi:hypothetical protein
LLLILDRWRERRRLEDYRASVGPTILANIHRRPHSKAKEPADFFPSLRAAGTLSDGAPAQTAEQQLAMFRHLMGGRIREAPAPVVVDIDSNS